MNQILLYQIRKLRSVLSLKNENVSMLVLVSQFPAQWSVRGGGGCAGHEAPGITLRYFNCSLLILQTYNKLKALCFWSYATLEETPFIEFV